MPLEFHLMLFLTCLAGGLAALFMIVGAALVLGADTPRVRRSRRA